MATEQQIQKKIIAMLEETYDAYVVKVVSASKGGVPDILACISGRFVAIEVKRSETKNNVSKLQDYNLHRVEQRGGISMVAWDVQMVKDILHDNRL